MLHELMMPLYRVLRLVTLPLLQQPGPDLPQLMSGPARKARISDRQSTYTATELMRSPDTLKQLSDQRDEAALHAGGDNTLQRLLPVSEAGLQQHGGEGPLLPQSFPERERLPGILSAKSTALQISDTTRPSTATWVPSMQRLAAPLVADESIRHQSPSLASLNVPPMQLQQNRWRERVQDLSNYGSSAGAGKIVTSPLQNAAITAVLPFSLPFHHPMAEPGILLPALNHSSNEPEEAQQLGEFTNRVMPVRRADDTSVQNQQAQVNGANSMEFHTPAHLTVHMHNGDARATDVRQQIEEVLLEIFDTMNPL